MFKIISYTLIVIFIISSCKSDPSKGKLALDVPQDDTAQANYNIADGVIQDISNISSPIEMAATIKNLGAEYSSKYLAPPEKADDLLTSFDQAFHLGIYGADLGYLNMYNKTSGVLQYIDAINKLAGEINVDQFFDFVSLNRLAQKSENLDSLMLISQRSFNEMDRYLKNNNRRDLSTLMIVGVWIEGLYLATQVAKDMPQRDNDLAEKIGDQKIVLGKLLFIVENFDSPRFAKLLKELQSLNEYFKEVEIAYIHGDPIQIIDEETNTLTIDYKAESIVKITDDQLKNIINITEEIRNRLISI